MDPIRWQTVDEVPDLPPGRVHLWWQDLHSDRLDVDALQGLLNERERERVERIRVDRVRHEFAAARAVLKILLSRYLDRHPAELEFSYGPLGKPSTPALENGDELCFNYTDSQGRALYAFAWNLELGVDVERLTRIVEAERIIKRYFAEKESAALLEMPEEERRRMFLACWTRKEGYGKALGVGIRFPFDCRELCIDCRASPLSVTDHIHGESWDIHQLYPATDFVAALVHPSGDYDRHYLRLAEIM